MVLAFKIKLHGYGDTSHTVVLVSVQVLRLLSCLPTVIPE
jgi:hypothetical protein